jgi:hypothetical protein
MKKRSLWGLVAVAALSLLSCPQAAVQNPYAGLKPGTFWARNLATKGYDTVDAVLLAEGEKCLVWAESSAGVSIDTGRAIAGVYDSQIYDKIVGTFGSDEIMTRGDVDGNGKLILLLLDIKDGFQDSGAYTAGFFNSSDLLDTSFDNHSNKSDMIYVDTYPSKLGSPDSYATIAHELQHFINFTTRYTEEYQYRRMDEWVDEGLSSAAEQIYLGRHNSERVSQFMASETVRRGNNFFVWGNEDGNVLDDYSTVYLFFQWLRIQSGGTEIYKRIIESPDYDYRAVTGAITGAFAEALGSTSWETTLRSWFAANYINSPEGLYGYRDEIPNLRVYALGGRTRELLPGEGVYSMAGSSPGALFPDEGNIKYAGLRSADSSPSEGPALSLDTLYPNGRLLTFNSNARNGAYGERGRLTDGAEEPIPRFSSTGRSAGQAGNTWIIDARDILGRPGR